MMMMFLMSRFYDIERTHTSLLSVKRETKFTSSDEPERAIPEWRCLTALEMNYCLGLGRKTHGGSSARLSQDNPIHHHAVPTIDCQTFESSRYLAPKSLHVDPNHLELSGTPEPLGLTRGLRIAGGVSSVKPFKRTTTRTTMELFALAKANRQQRQSIPL